MEADKASPMMVASAVNDVNTSTPSQMTETVKLATGLVSMITNSSQTQSVTHVRELRDSRPANFVLPVRPCR